MRIFVIVVGGRTFARRSPANTRCFRSATLGRCRWPNGHASSLKLKNVRLGTDHRAHRSPGQPANCAASTQRNASGVDTLGSMTSSATAVDSQFAHPQNSDERGSSAAASAVMARYAPTPQPTSADDAHSAAYSAHAYASRKTPPFSSAFFGLRIMASPSVGVR